MVVRYYTTYDAHCLTHAFNVFSKWKVPLIIADMNEIRTSKYHRYYFHRSKKQSYTDYDNECLLYVVNNLALNTTSISLEKLLSIQTFNIPILLNNILIYMRYTLSDDFCDFMGLSRNEERTVNEGIQLCRNYIKTNKLCKFCYITPNEQIMKLFGLDSNAKILTKTLLKELRKHFINPYQPNQYDYVLK